MEKIKWGKSKDGYIKSKCGWFEIEPQHWGCVSARNYVLKYMSKAYKADTQREAKQKADLIAMRTNKKKEVVK